MQNFEAEFETAAYLLLRKARQYSPSRMPLPPPSLPPPSSPSSLLLSQPIATAYTHLWQPIAVVSECWHAIVTAALKFMLDLEPSLLVLIALLSFAAGMSLALVLSCIESCCLHQHRASLGVRRLTKVETATLATLVLTSTLPTLFVWHYVRSSSSGGESPPHDELALIALTSIVIASALHEVGSRLRAAIERAKPSPADGGDLQANQQLGLGDSTSLEEDQQLRAAALSSPRRSVRMRSPFGTIVHDVDGSARLSMLHGGTRIVERSTCVSPYEALRVSASSVWRGLAVALAVLSAIPPLLVWQYVWLNSGEAAPHDELTLIALTSITVASALHDLILRGCIGVARGARCTEAENAAAENEAAEHAVADVEAGTARGLLRGLGTEPPPAAEGSQASEWMVLACALLSRSLERCVCAWGVLVRRQEESEAIAKAAAQARMTSAVSSLLHLKLRRAWNQLAAHGRVYRLSRLAAQRAAKLAGARAAKDSEEVMTLSERRFRRARCAAEETVRDESVEGSLVAAMREAKAAKGGGSQYMASQHTASHHAGHEHAGHEHAATERTGGNAADDSCSETSLPSYLMLGLTVDAMRQALDALPASAVTSFHKNGGFAIPEFGAGVPGATTGAFGYGNPQARAVTGYVNRHCLALEAERTGGKSHCELLKQSGSPHVGLADVYVSCPRRLPMSRVVEVCRDELTPPSMLHTHPASPPKCPHLLYALLPLHLAQVLEAYLSSHPQLDGGRTRFWLFDYSTRQTRNGAAQAFALLDKVIGGIGHTILILEPWRDPSVLRRALCLMEVVFTQRASTFIAGDALPGHPRGGATWSEAPGGEYGADRNEAGDVYIPHKLEFAMTIAERRAFEHAFHSQYSLIEELLAHIARVDLRTAECRTRASTPNAARGIRTRVLQKLVGGGEPLSAHGGEAGDETGDYGEGDDGSGHQEGDEAGGETMALSSGSNVETAKVVDGGEALCRTAAASPASIAELLHRQMSKDKARAANVQARKLLRHAIVQQGQLLLSQTRVDERRHTRIVAHLSLLVEQVRHANLCDELGSTHEQTLEAATTLAVKLSSLHALPNASKHRANAIVLLTDVVIERQRQRGSEHPSTLTALNNLALAHHANGDFPLAVKLIEQVRQVRCATLGETHPSTLAVSSTLGYLLHTKGEDAGAETTLRGVLDGRRASYGDRHHATVISIISLANVLYAQDKQEEAEKLYREALATSRADFSPTHALSLICLNNLGCLLQSIGWLQEAEACLREGLWGSTRVYGGMHVETLIASSK